MSADAALIELRQSSRYASRKFLLAVATLVACWAAFVVGRLNPAEAIDLTKWALGLYFAGNVGTWLADALKVRL